MLGILLHNKDFMANNVWLSECTHYLINGKISSSIKLLLSPRTLNNSVLRRIVRKR